MAKATATNKKATQPASKAAMLAAISKAPGGNAALAAAMAAPASTIATLQAATATATATPTAKVPASVAVLASITAAPTIAAGTLPATFAAMAGYTVKLTAKGAASSRLQARMLPTAANGPCPFALALYNGQGKTLAQAWANVTATGHGQQGRGKGGYNATNAISTYTNGNGWFALVAPTK